MTAIMSFGGKKSNSLAPEKVLETLLNGNYFLNADQLAQVIVDQDSATQIIDVSNPDKYKSQSIPGAINIPLEKILQPGSKRYFESETIKSVFYSDDQNLTLQAWMLSIQQGYPNLYILKGGLSDWDSIVMRSSFSGEKISPQENALFEKRYKARRLFQQWNAMSDSLKASFFAAKKIKDKELVGGCE
jgi:rhodanese-related sulfurtransferase